MSFLGCVGRCFEFISFWVHKFFGCVSFVCVDKFQRL